MNIRTTPYWLDTSPIPPFPRLGENLKVDVVVIGAGITGITAAYLLKKSGVRVAVLERERVASIDTGHTTAHVTYVTDTRLRELVKTFGRDDAQAVWDAGAASMTQIQEIMGAEGVEPEFTWVPGFLHAPHGANSGQEEESLREDAKLAQELSFDATYLDRIPFMDQPGIRFANQAKFHPCQYLGALATRIPGHGSYLFEQSAVEELQEEPLQVKANGFSISCDRVVIATHVPLQGLAGTMSAALFQTKLALYSTYAIGAKIPTGAVPEASYWDTADPYNYLRIERQDGHDYAIYGGGDHKTGQVEKPETRYAEIERRLKKLIPGADVDHRWSGQVVETNDGVPFIGEMTAKQFISTGYGGNGMTFGTLGGMMACDYVIGRKNPWRELFDVHRKKIRGGAWDYLKENKDYPFYLVKDLLFSAAHTSLNAIKPGEGKIVQLKSGKVAASRDEEGKLTVKSAICTHMGCVVRWNVAEKTWDCPCHGSRFKATGEVIGGPAETPLSEAEAG